MSIEKFHEVNDPRIEAELDRLGLPQPKPAKPAPIPRNDTFRHYEGDF